MVASVLQWSVRTCADSEHNSDNRRDPARGFTYQLSARFPCDADACGRVEFRWFKYSICLAGCKFVDRTGGSLPLRNNTKMFVFPDRACRDDPRTHVDLSPTQAKGAVSLAMHRSTVAVVRAASRLPTFNVFHLTVRPKELQDPVQCADLQFVAASPHIHQVELLFTDVSIYGDELIGVDVLAALVSNPAVHCVVLWVNCSNEALDMIMHFVLRWTVARHIILKSSARNALRDDVYDALSHHEHIRCVDISYCGDSLHRGTDRCGTGVIGAQRNGRAPGRLDRLFGCDSRLNCVVIRLHGVNLTLDTILSLKAAMESPHCGAVYVHLDHPHENLFTGRRFIQHSIPLDRLIEVQTRNEHYDLMRFERVLQTTLAHQRMSLFWRMAPAMRALAHLWRGTSHANEMQRIPLEILCYLFDSMHLDKYSYTGSARLPFCIDV